MLSNSRRTLSHRFLSLSILLTCQNCASAQSSLGDAVFEKANFIFERSDHVRYCHHEVPAARQVRFEGELCTIHSDCSGFVSYVLHEVAPKHYRIVHEFERGHPYPQAAAYSRFFARLSTSSPDAGWLKLANYSDLRRGDIIAWRKPHQPGSRGGNTGHVMIAAGQPAEPLEKKIDGEIVRFADIPVIDCSSVDHFQPEELPPHAGQRHRNGLGKGTVRVILDAENRAIGYWEGTYWGEGHKEIKHPTMTRSVDFARLVSNL